MLLMANVGRLKLDEKCTVTPFYFTNKHTIKSAIQFTILDCVKIFH